tara:strand:+ start:57 stop:740 length:684 start_codon:yes stop_codon:yes gene_type:complete
MEGQTASAGGGGGSLYEVTPFSYDEENNCACTTTGQTAFLIDDEQGALAGATPSVNDVVGVYKDSPGESYCAKVTAVNQGGTAVGYFEYEGFSDCAECNEMYAICFGEGGEFCLLPHMLVKLIDGSFIKVVDLNLGDLIESPYGFTEINELVKDHPRDGYFIINNELYISDDHPILVDDKMIKAKDYPGEKKYVNLSTNTVYIGTHSPTFNVYCEDNVYVVDGRYKP